jgi:hypothetical protein
MVERGERKQTVDELGYLPFSQPGANCCST